MKPVIVVDIDNTILDPSRRKARAYIDAVKATGRLLDDPTITSKIHDASRSRFDFDPMKSIVDKIVTKETFNRFLSNRYLSFNGTVLDDPVPGSVKFLRDAVKNGCDIAYITGRSRDGKEQGGMVKGTLESLSRLGFPVPSYPRLNGDPVSITFKEARHVKDELYKPAIMREIEKTHDILAIFEDNKEVLDAVNLEFPGVHRYVVMIYPNMDPASFACKPGDASVTCITDFTSLSITPGCKIRFADQRQSSLF